MPITKGSLNPDQRRKITKNLISLKRDMDAKDLIDYFIQEEIFEFKDLEYITGFNPNTTESRNNAFFKLLFECPPNAYDVFLMALTTVGQSHLAELVEKTQIESVSQEPIQESQANHEWLKDIPDEVRARRLTDKDLSKLAQTLGKNWQVVGYTLGLSKTDVEQCEMEQSYLTMQIFTALNRWKCRMVEKATLENFVLAVSDSGASADWAMIKNVAASMDTNKS